MFDCFVCIICLFLCYVFLMFLLEGETNLRHDHIAPTHGQSANQGPYHMINLLGWLKVHQITLNNTYI